MNIGKIMHSPVVNASSTKLKRTIMPAVFALGLATTPLVSKAQQSNEDKFVTTTEQLAKTNEVEKNKEASKETSDSAILFTVLGTLIGVAGILEFAARAGGESLFNILSSDD